MRHRAGALMVIGAMVNATWRLPVLGWDMTRLAWIIAAAALLLVLALISIWHAHGHSRRAKIVWTVVAVVLPIAGPIAWALAGRESRRTRANR